MADKKQKEEKTPGGKSCFVVGPIGSDGSETRIEADWLLKGIIEPVLTAHGYNVVRADTIADPGSLSGQIINAVCDADLVVADMTDHNANAFYELAIRHVIGGKTIHMIRDDQRIPFDNQDYRATFYSRETYESLEKSKTALAKAVSAVDAKGYVVSNPYTKARGAADLNASGDDKDKMIADMRREINENSRQLKDFLSLRSTDPFGNITFSERDDFLPEWMGNSDPKQKHVTFKKDTLEFYEAIKKHQRAQAVAKEENIAIGGDPSDDEGDDWET